MQITGMTPEKMLEQMRPEALKTIQNGLVLEAIAKAESIEITDEQLEKEFAEMAEAYKMDIEKVKEYMGIYEKEQMKKDLAIQAAVDMIVEAAVEA